MGSLSVHRIQYKLNLLSDEFFPLLGDKGSQMTQEALVESPALKKLKSDDTNDSSIVSNVVSVKSRSFSPYIQPNTLHNYHLRPKKNSDSTNELKLAPNQFIEETMAIEDFPRMLHEVRQQLGEKRRQLSIKEFPKIVFLGTGSSIPNKTRNTSGILLEIE